MVAAKALILRTVANGGGRTEEMAEGGVGLRAVATGMLYDPGGAVCCCKETAVDDGECCKGVAAAGEKDEERVTNKVKNEDKTGEKNEDKTGEKNEGRIDVKINVEADVRVKVKADVRVKERTDVKIEETENADVSNQANGGVDYCCSRLHSLTRQLEYSLKNIYTKQSIRHSQGPRFRV